jgi:hypothetical protein
LQALWQTSRSACGRGKAEEGFGGGDEDVEDDDEDDGDKNDDDKNALLAIMGIYPGPAPGIRLTLDVSLYLLDPSTFLKLVQWQQAHALLPKCAP